MSALSNFIGKTLGEWTVVSAGTKKYTLVCSCSCGTVKTFSYSGVKLLREGSSCGCKSKHPHPKQGDIFPTNGGDVEVLERIDCNTIRVRFLDGGFEKTVAGKELRNGCIANPYSRDVYGIGFHGAGNFVPSLKGRHAKAYRAWTGVLQRASGSSTFLSANPTYVGCTVSAEWHSFQKFAEWYYNQKGCDENFDVDKDLLFKGNKHYGPEECVLLPRCINSFMVSNNASRGDLPLGVSKHHDGVRAQCQLGKGKKYIGKKAKSVESAWHEYKTVKESYAKELAEKWRDKIDPRAYEALMNYTVEITD